MMESVRSVVLKYGNYLKSTLMRYFNEEFKRWCYCNYHNFTEEEIVQFGIYFPLSVDYWPCEGCLKTLMGIAWFIRLSIRARFAIVGKKLRKDANKTKEMVSLVDLKEDELLF